MPQTAASSIDWSVGSALAAIGSYLLLPLKLAGFDKRLVTVEGKTETYEKSCGDCREENAKFFSTKAELNMATQTLQNHIDQRFIEQREWISLVMKKG